MQLRYIYLLLVCWSIVSLSSISNGQSRNSQNTRSNQQKAKSSSKMDVRATFAKAQELYNEERYEEASQIYHRIINVYPAHEPSIIQYAKCLYRLDKISEAYFLFSRVDPTHLDIATSYEYGLTFFWQQQYSGALFALKRVPAGHALYDLANYYGGISALKLRRYSEAEDMMEKAVVLPDKLIASKKLYQKHILELKLLEEKKNLALEKKQERQRIKGEMKTPPQQQQQVQATTTPTTASKTTTTRRTKRVVKKQPTAVRRIPELVGVRNIYKEASLSYDYKNEKYDLHGFSEKSLNQQITSFEYRNGPKWINPVKHSKRPMVVGTQFGLGFEHQSTSGEERRNVQFEDGSDIERVYTNKALDKDTQSMKFKVNPWIESPINDDAWWSAGLDLEFKYIDFANSKSATNITPNIILAFKYNKLIFSGEYAYSEILMLGNERSISRHKLNVSMEKEEVVGEFMYRFYLDHYIFDYINEELEGPTSATSLSSNMYFLLPVYLRLGVWLGAQYQSQNVMKDQDTYGAVSADGQVYSGKVYLQVEPFPWISVEVSQSYQAYVWDVDPVEKQEVFEKNQPEFVSAFQVKGSLNLLF